jgi:hypothetical protein
MLLKELSAFKALYFVQGAFIIVFGATFTLGALLFNLERFYFFLQSAFLFLHSAFLMLHSAFLKILCVSQHLYIFSNCESARYFIYLVQLLFQFFSMKRLSLD